MDSRGTLNEPGLGELLAKDRHLLFAVLASCAVFVLKIAVIAKTSLVDDEAYYFLWTRHLALGYVEHAPLLAWFLKASALLFGETGFGVRKLLGVLCYAALSAVLYSFGRDIRDRRTGLLLATAFNLTPFFAGASAGDDHGHAAGHLPVSDALGVPPRPVPARILAPAGGRLPRPRAVVENHRGVRRGGDPAVSLRPPRSSARQPLASRGAILRCRAGRVLAVHLLERAARFCVRALGHREAVAEAGRVRPLCPSCGRHSWRCISRWSSCCSLPAGAEDCNRRAPRQDLGGEIFSGFGGVRAACLPPRQILQEQARSQLAGDGVRRGAGPGRLAPWRALAAKKAGPGARQPSTTRSGSSAWSWSWRTPSRRFCPCRRKSTPTARYYRFQTFDGSFKEYYRAKMHDDVRIFALNYQIPSMIDFLHPAGPGGRLSQPRDLPPHCFRLLVRGSRLHRPGFLLRDRRRAAWRRAPQPVAPASKRSRSSFPIAAARKPAASRCIPAAATGGGAAGEIGRQHRIGCTTGLLSRAPSGAAESMHGQPAITADEALQRRDDPQAGVGEPAVLRRGTEGLQGRRDPRRQGRGRQARHRETLARHAARHLRRRREQAH